MVADFHSFYKVDNAKCNLFRRKLLADALVDCQCPRLRFGGKNAKNVDERNAGVWTELSLGPGSPVFFANPVLDNLALSLQLTQG